MLPSAQIACSTVSCSGESKSAISTGIPPARTTAAVWDDVPEAMFVMAQAASNCTFASLKSFSFSISTGTRPRSMTVLIGGDSLADNTRRRPLTARNWSPLLVDLKSYKGYVKRMNNKLDLSYLLYLVQWEPFLGQHARSDRFFHRTLLLQRGGVTILNHISPFRQLFISRRFSKLFSKKNKLKKNLSKISLQTWTATFRRLSLVTSFLPANLCCFDRFSDIFLFFLLFQK